jgi:hypothetical protein
VETVGEIEDKRSANHNEQQRDIVHENDDSRPPTLWQTLTGF